MPSKMKTCEDYRTALNDAVAAAIQPSFEIRSHLDACASCREAFREELQLFAAMESGLRIAVNAEVPASLLPRVRTELSQRHVSHHSWVPASAAMAAVVALVAVIVFVRGFARDSVPTNPAVNSFAHNIPPAEIRSVPAVDPAVDATSSLAKIKPLGLTETPTAVEVAQVETVRVLIPAGQKRAMEALLASIQAGKVDGEVLLAEKPEKSLEELQVSPLDFSLIEVKPLGAAGTELPSQNEETNR